MEPHNNWLYNNTEWFYTVIYQNPIFFIDYWSFVHLWVGAFLYLSLVRLQFKYLWIKLAGVLLVYEIVEIAIKYLAIHIFKPETFKDQFVDIIVGMIGGLLVHLIIKMRVSTEVNKSSISQGQIFISLISSFTISFLWVGYYDYSDTIFSFSGRFNWFVFLLWSVILFVILIFYNWIKKFQSKSSITVFMTWAIFCLGVLILEFSAPELWGGNLLIKSSESLTITKFPGIDKLILLFIVLSPLLAIWLFNFLYSFYESVLIIQRRKMN